MRFPAAAPVYVAAKNGGGSTRKALASKSSSCRRDTCPPCCEVFRWDRGSTRKAPALQAGSCGSKNPPVPPITHCGEGGVVVSAVS